MKNPPRTPQAPRTAPGRQTLTERLAALGELVRLRILRILESEELSVGEVAQVVQLPQSTVSRHLKVLADGDWVVRRTVGTATLYRLVLDDLDAEARALWLTVRAQLASEGDLAEDARRLATVIAERSADPAAFFGRVAGEWDQIRNEWFGTRFTPGALLSLLPADWTVADLGCGTGNAAELLAPNVDRVIAIDPSEPMLSAARKRLAPASNVQFRSGSIARTLLADGSVDACVSVLVLHHVESIHQAMIEMRRILRDSRAGGVALIIDMLEHDRTEYKHTMGHKHLGFAPKFITKSLKDAGFSRASVRVLPGEPDAKGPGLFAAIGRL